MLKYKLIRFTYQNIAKPVFFAQDAEDVHNRVTELGEFLGSNRLTLKITDQLFTFRSKKLKQKLNGLIFENPIGLSAGFDYDGHLAKILKSVGFGFNTVGTVTAKAYEGNKKPRLARLVKSNSLLVNKGFKSDGADVVRNRLRFKNITNTTLGLSVGSTNIPENNTLPLIIKDYIHTFKTFANEDYVKYFELNISCPNLKMSSSQLSQPKNFENLVKNVSDMKIQKPIFVKMANELDVNTSMKLMEIGIKNGISGFIFSNLVKNRKNKLLNKEELEKVKDLKGNFSGKPCEINANRLIKNAYKNFRNQTTIIGCGGVFSAKDAYKKIKLGASLVQLITGMIFEGPQLIGEINEELASLIEKDGFKNISEAVGVEA